MTKQDIRKMAEQTGQEITYEDEHTILIENVFYGEDIVFEFDEDGKLILIGS